VGCEESGILRDALLDAGHDAYSCDLLPTASSRAYNRHFQGCILEVIKHYPSWDMAIFFPPCTHLASSGAVYWEQKKNDGRQQEAIDFVFKLRDSGIPKIAIENPVGVLSRVWRKPDQIVNPFQFGDPYRKKTCLWLDGLPLLIPTDIVEPVGSLHSGGRYGGRRKDGTRKVTPKSGIEKRCSKLRSKFHPGMAKAMAEQWGNL